MSGGEKKNWVIKNNLLAKGDWKLRYMYPKKKKNLYNIFTTLLRQVLSFRLLWVFIGGAKKLF